MKKITNDKLDGVTGGANDDNSHPKMALFYGVQRPISTDIEDIKSKLEKIKEETNMEDKDLNKITDNELGEVVGGADPIKDKEPEEQRPMPLYGIPAEEHQVIMPKYGVPGRPVRPITTEDNKGDKKPEIKPVEPGKDN